MTRSNYRTMGKKQLITHLCIIFALTSCKSGKFSQVDVSMKSFEDIQEEMLDVLLDKTTSADRLTDVMTQYGEYLEIAADNLDNIDMRVDAQRRSMLTISLLLEKFAQMDSLGLEISHAQMDSCLSRLVEVSSKWYYVENEIRPVIFREVYYNSYQNTDNPVPGYFRILVYLPAEQYSEPSVRLFYPQTAESDPYILFTGEEVNGVPVGGWGKQDIVGANTLEKKNAKGDGTPMNDLFGPDFLEKMLNNKHMYITFNSEKPASGIPGDLETAHLELSFFQDKYNEIAKHQ